jgi:hypothetical protein
MRLDSALKKKLSPIYLGPKNLDTFWCTGWAWNCQIIFRFASIHGRACLILCMLKRALYGIKCVLFHINSCMIYIIRNPILWLGISAYGGGVFVSLFFERRCHAHPVHQKVSRFFGPRYIGDDLFLGPNLVSFNRTVVPYEISKVNFRVETKILVSMSEEIWSIKKYQYK